MIWNAVNRKTYNVQRVAIGYPTRHKMLQEKKKKTEEGAKEPFETWANTTIHRESWSAASGPDETLQKPQERLLPQNGICACFLSLRQ